MGKFRLNASQVERLGNRDEQYAWEDEGENAIASTAEALSNAGFSQFVLRGNYFVSSTEDNDEEAPHIGQYRVKFHYNQCGTATIMAQQIQDDQDCYSFRKWNPEKRNVDIGQSTDAEQDGTCGNPCCCYICMCVNCLMNTLFEEVVDVARDGKLVSEQYFTEQEQSVGSAAKCIRPTGIFLCIFGHYLLFSPVIALLDMIPFIGWLLSWIVALAAIIFAVVVGLTLSVLTIAVAWVFFRPLIGIPLLLIVGASVYLTFFYDWGKASTVEGEDTTPTGDGTNTDTGNGDTTGGGGGS